ncbi:hypothetical protein Cgig2_002947 [Carnegiea gigantea]|uniref:Uncharacterized protein n=1 Tax=Carnegiea gigantea TaxID=171969 RepID=A0A9Q1JUB8_9CARY|nr:hypothetical protein Cgig2_002947 [Carnegiea gigantea]
MVQQILVDTRSAADIITRACLTKLHYDENSLKVIKMPVVGFGGQATYVRNQNVYRSSEEKGSSQTIEANFPVMDIPLAYDVILGCLTLSVIKAVVVPYLILIYLYRMTKVPQGDTSKPNKVRKRISVDARNIEDAFIPVMTMHPPPQMQGNATSPSDMPPTPPATHPSYDNAFSLTFYKMGHEHTRCFPKGNETMERHKPGSCDGHHRKGSPEVHLEEHDHKTQDPKDNGR